MPGSEGVFQILAEHEPFVSELKQGELHIEGVNDQLYHFEVSQGGIAEVSRNQATILL